MARWQIAPLFIRLVCFVVFCSGCGAMPNKPLDVRPVGNAVTLEGRNVQGMNAVEVRAVAEELAKSMTRSPRDAYFDNDNGQIQAGYSGCVVSIDETVQAVMRATPNTAVGVVVRVSPSALSVQNLRDAKPVGSFQTPILDGSEGRMTNIKLACAQINNVQIAPGGVFSFNEMVGEPSEGKGYQLAPIIIEGGDHALGVGGGVCQVSSTLYNAALAAGLEIVERHSHSQAVNYVPPGRDATTYTDKDLKICNHLGRSLMLRAFAQQQQVHVDVLALPEER